MGKVAMDSRLVCYIDGYPVNEATLYVYCDKCESFNIKTYVRPRKWLIIAGGLIMAGWLISRNEDWVPCLVVVALLAVLLPWEDMLLSYKCRACKNTHITDHNSLHFEPYDKHVVDVADRFTQKRYIDDDVIGFSRYT